MSPAARLTTPMNCSACTVTVYRAVDGIRVLTAKDALTGEDVVPGFEFRVAELLAGL